MTPTPTANSRLPLRLGGFASLREALDYAAQGDTGVNFFDARGALVATMTYRRLRALALAAATRLRNAGLRPGDRVALVADTSPEFLVLFYGCQYAGLVPCPLPYKAFPGAHEAYQSQLRLLLVATDARAVLAPSGVLAVVDEAAGASQAVLAFDAIVDTTETSTEPVAAIADEDRDAAASPDDEALAYVQFSSGSTAQPKGVLVSQRALMANADAIARHGLRMHAHDRACSWLPLYHDMGLVGFSVVALCGQRSVDYLAPTTFAARPLVWLRLMSAQATTIVYAPGFAWRLAAQRYRAEDALDLSALRIAGVGGDMVQAQVLVECAQALASSGFRLSAFQPSYGLAEATLAVTMSDADSDPRIDRVICAMQADGTVVARHEPDEGASGMRDFVGCGRPLPGTEVRVENDRGQALPQRRIGRVWVRGPALMRGYQCANAGERVLRDDGFLDTGDLGYFVDGELFVTGRAKDLILVRGRNLWPQDVESLVERVAPLSAGDCAAIGIERDGEETLVVLVQRRATDSQSASDLQQRLAAAISQALGVAASIVFVPPRSLPYTSSGKLARARARGQYLAGVLGIDTPPARKDNTEIPA
ncbi:fatty acyl-AMP ligase [Lysobacter cavernae]|uniref:Fatty acyl-AMP ligase n=1 Tax=Lysobacter cavernae TaxID=1685901 RepID=A0ABV7RP10_9GAMM